MKAAGRLWSAIGAPARALLMSGIRLYRATLSGLLGGQCRFYPSCSHYAEEAILAHGALKGSALSVWRVLRCNPFGRGGIDRVSPGVEPSIGPGIVNDDVIRNASNRAVATLNDGARS